MHPPEVREAAMALIGDGINDCEISRRLGIPRTTIRDWRHPQYASRREYSIETCPRCWRPAKPMRFTAADYAELLGLYLGDGHISTAARTDRLRIALDAKYPLIIQEGRELLERCFPENAVAVVRSGVRGNVVNLSVYSRHLKCLFPQHGPGPKHARRIRLENWQWQLGRSSPWEFLRGCIRSDGCFFINRTDAHRPAPYEYPSYQFGNASGDIVDLFIAACELVGIADYRRVFNRRRRIWDVRINRRASVAKLMEHVGVKS